MIISNLNLRVSAGKAAPNPGIASSLGPKGVNLMQFCKVCNEASSGFAPGEEVRVRVSIFKDKTFKVKMLGPSFTNLIKSNLALKKFSSAPGKEIVKSITDEELRSICEKSLPNMNTMSIDSALKTAVGTLRSMGIVLKKSS